MGVAQDQIDEADDSKEDLIDLILAASAKEDPPGVAAEVRTSNKKSKNLATSAKEGPPGAAAEHIERNIWQFLRALLRF